MRLKSTRLFHNIAVIKHYKIPNNIGTFDTNHNITTGTAVSPACGDKIELQINVNDNGQIIDARFKQYGCCKYANASGSYLTEYIKGTNINHASNINLLDVMKYLNIPQMRTNCIMLVNDGINSAISKKKK